MLAVRIYQQDEEIDARLVGFGVDRSELIQIARAVVAARADAVDDDPASAEGQFAYIYGTRLTRQTFRKHGWLRHRQDNVESVKHPKRDLKVIYQSVELAADAIHEPRAISGKGSGADRLIFAGQGCLFSADELNRAAAATLTNLKVGAWFFCVSVNGEDVRAELSLSSGVTNGNFGPFIERTFILREGEWESMQIDSTAPTSAVEFEPIVTRK